MLFMNPSLGQPMGFTITQFPATFTTHPPAPEEDIDALMGCFPGIPRAYLDFLRAHDGGEGWLESGRYFRFWKASEIGRMNQDYEVSIYAPQFLIFGTDGCDSSFAFDTRSVPWCVGELPFVGMSERYFRERGTFEEFVAMARAVETAW